MPSQILISVIMPVYNACRDNTNYLLEALESVVNQSSKHFELIIVDDGSTDESGQVCKVFIQNNPQTRIFYYLKENGGQSSARNFGAKKALGEYLSFIDQDDAWKENKLELTVPHLDADTDLIYTDGDTIKEDGSIMYSGIHNNYLCGAPHPKNSIEQILFKDIFVMPGLMTIKKETFLKVNGFDEGLSGYEDDDLFLRIYEVGKMKYLPVSTLKWRIYETNYSFSNRMIKSRLFFCDKLLKNYTNHGRDLRRVHKISYRFFREFLSQAILQYKKDDKLYVENISGAKIVLRKTPLFNKIFFSFIFLFRDHIAIKMINWISLIYARLKLLRHPVNTIILVLRNIINRFFPLFPNRLNRELIARMFIRGEGIEIGALNGPLKTPKNAKVKYVDRMSEADLMKQYPLKAGELTKIDIIDDGETLQTVADSTLDFVVANHFLEHCQNPIKAITNMLRVLRKGGIIYLSIPDKNYTFDSDRPITTFEHIIRDYNEGPNWSKTSHFADWVRNVDKVREEKEFNTRLSFLLQIDYSIHYHVWTQFEMVELLFNLKKKLNSPFSIELIFSNGIEVIFILKKQ
jgi:glycosyltransferase involved in cell wall biosynthesis/2-polyprenyl-3-methyl-5-hydroxy-6-metoxy-1,4-benzoquinol methylase